MPPATGHRATGRHDADRGLAGVLADAAAGRFPPPDGRVEVWPLDDDGTSAVVELTGRSYVLTNLSHDDLLDAGLSEHLHGFGGCTHPAVLTVLAAGDATSPVRRIGSLDAMLVTQARPGPVLPERHDLGDHPRVVRARHHRSDVRVFGDERGLVTLGRGLAGRLELSIERLEDGQGARPGTGRALITAGLAAVAPGTVVWAQVAPGNAASLRAFLAVGFTPVGAEVVITVPS